MEADTAGKGLTSTSTFPPSTSAQPSEWDFEIEVIDMHTLQTQVTIPRNEDSKSIAEALMFQGYIGNTPEHPSIAFSVPTLEHLRQTRSVQASFSVEKLTKVIPYSARYRTALSNAFDVYLELMQIVDGTVSKVGSTGSEGLS
ncbi:hypothetical protein D9613_002453 [Agrocybe pediades]|uniref:Uncharacterized protein n=1 Tax=Agrocybe pediades TaxID=84607 RepID=A0A8H4QP47_9AGAR|nr:hypothetical protein D9613_002453 [Agrocybe pediades]